MKIDLDNDDIQILINGIRMKATFKPTLHGELTEALSNPNTTLGQIKTIVDRYNCPAITAQINEDLTFHEPSYRMWDSDMADELHDLIRNELD